ncbi:MAG: SpoIID/LytB domain-containing protein, partial [Chloroflexi bacterium]|nr:SpoIID/LytB domain-containing protein [Chloroflexota bacterium]
AAWSGDGRHLLVTRPAGRVPIPGGWRIATDLWAVPADGAAPVRLASDVTRPSPGPGSLVAFVRMDAAGQASLWVVDADGAPTRRVPTRIGPVDADTPPAWAEGGLVYTVQGRPYRAGDPVALALPPGRATPAPRGDRWAVLDDAGLLLVQPDGMTARVPGLPAPIDSVAWSSDGSVLACVAGRPPSQLWLVDAERATAQRLHAADSGFVGRPAWSPDQQYLLFASTPSGNQVNASAELWGWSPGRRAAPRRLTANETEESAPAWSPDGAQVAFLRAGDVWLVDAAALLAGALVDRAPRRAPPLAPALVAPSGQLTPPATIRVYHTHFEPLGTIEVVDFETYVKRVVPFEMPASWPAEALQAQAVAARSYGWYQAAIHAAADWDVTDWTEWQVCGPDDERDPRTDAAVDATAGQYVYHSGYPGRPICAFYSAEQGDPTESYGDVAYVRAVSDPVCFGQTREGHGWGLCQWGARRWAETYGWNYQQILAHYYTAVTVDLPAGPEPDVRAPLVGITDPWLGWYLTSNRALVAVNASDERSGIAQVSVVATYATTAGVTATLVSDNGTPVLWDLTGVPDQRLLDAAMTITATARDGAGHTSVTPAQVIGLDRHPPAVTATLTSADGLTLTLALTATDDGPGTQSGVTHVALSNDWRWEAEDVYTTYHNPANCGAVVTDTAALNGWAWWGQTGVHAPGDWYGPYAMDLPVGPDYLALFRLKTTAVTNTAEIARLLVGVNADETGAHILGLRSVRGIDVRAAGVYQEFGVRLRLAGPVTTGLEFIVQYRGVADVWLDRIVVVSDPTPLVSPVTWQRAANDRVLVKAFDAAGNPSPDAVIVTPWSHHVYLPLVLHQF